MSINEDSSDEDTPATQTTNNDTNDLKKIFPIKLTHNKILKLRKQYKVICFVNYKYKIDPRTTVVKNYYYIFLGNTMNSTLSKLTRHT